MLDDLVDVVSDFWNQYWRKIVISAVVLPTTSCCLTFYVLSRPEPGPGKLMDEGTTHNLHLYHSTFLGRLKSDSPDGIYFCKPEDAISDCRLLAENMPPWTWVEGELSPNEKRAALVGATQVINPSSELWVINTDGSRRVQLTEVESFKYDHSPFWVDKRTIGFIRSRDRKEDEHLRVVIDNNNIPSKPRPYDP